MLWLALRTPGRSGTKLEAYHQSLQPQSFSLSPSVFRDFGSLLPQGVAASFSPAFAATALHLLSRRCGVFGADCCGRWRAHQVRRCGVRVCLQLRRRQQVLHFTTPGDVRHYDSQCAYVLIVPRVLRSQETQLSRFQGRCVDDTAGSRMGSAK